MRSLLALCLLASQAQADVFNGSSSISILMDDSPEDMLVATIQHFNSRVDPQATSYVLTYDIPGHGPIQVLIEITSEVLPCIYETSGCTDRATIISWPDTLVVDETSVETWENNSSYIRLYLNLLG